MSELSRVSIRYKIFEDGEVIELKELSACPEKITIRAADGGLGIRVDVAQHDGNDLAWLALLTPEFQVEIS